MHVTRLVIEEGTSTFSLRLHPRLTVVAGVEEAARTGLVSELIGGLGSTRRGINLEVTDDRGRRLAVLRPSTGGHRVVDLGEGIDVSEEFRGPDGRLDLLGRYGIDARKANDVLHLDRKRIAAASRVDDDVRRLAELDQGDLWSAAARVRITDDELRNVMAEAPTGTDDAKLIDRIEQKHQEAEQAQARYRRLMVESKRVAAVALLAGVTVTAVQPERAVSIAMIGVIATLLSISFRARLAAAERQEKQALQDAGVGSYLGFVVNRVNELMDDTEARRRRIAVAEDHRGAAVQWTQIAGDVSVDWALEHHEEIETAARLRRELSALGQISSTAPTLDADTTALAQAVISHVGMLRHIGTGGESFPLIIDDPFTEVEPSMKLTLVELLARTSGSPQVIFLTDQDEVASWARLEALTGEVALVEPMLEPASPSEEPQHLVM